MPTTLPTDRSALACTAQQLTSDGRGILAADESITTMSKRLAAAQITATATSRRDYREVLLTATGLSDSVSGVILSDETFDQSLADGRPFPYAAYEAGVLPGVKVDTGTTPLPWQGGALVAEGLDGLDARMASYAQRGAAFAKWRAVFDVKTINEYVTVANAHALARYAALCQRHGVVPIVEPEVLCHGDHDIAASAAATHRALDAVFAELARADVELSGIVLKPNFVTPGLDATPATPSDVAATTFDVLRSNVPAEVPGIAFLSGGHPTTDACAFLRTLSAFDRLPWHVTFSFGRALVSDALHAWAGDAANTDDAQRRLLDNCGQAALATRP